MIIKIMRFVDFLRVPILGMPTFRESSSSLHQDEEKPDIELFLRIVPLLYITLLVGVVEGKKRIVDRESGQRREKSVSPQPGE